jgi:hypothetical protein
MEMKMNNKNKPAAKSWNEIEILLSTIAIALTLGLWNLFASSRKPADTSTDANATLPPQQDTPIVVTITPTPPLMLLPGQTLLLGGVLPSAIPSQPTVVTTTNSNNNGGGASHPPKTHSSHP